MVVRMKCPGLASGMARCGNLNDVFRKVPLSLSPPLPSLEVLFSVTGGLSVCTLLVWQHPVGFARQQEWLFPACARENTQARCSLAQAESVVHLWANHCREGDEGPHGPEVGVFPSRAANGTFVLNHRESKKGSCPAGRFRIYI